MVYLEAVTQRCYVNKVLKKTRKNSQENNLRPATLLKKRLWHGCFPVNFLKFLGTRFLTEHLRWWLLLLISRDF